MILKESIFVQSMLKLPDFRGVNISWIPGTHILLIINSFTETLCDVDDCTFHSLPLFIPIFCVLPVSLRDCLYREKDVGG